VEWKKTLADSEASTTTTGSGKRMKKLTLGAIFLSTGVLAGPHFDGAQLTIPALEYTANGVTSYYDVTLTPQSPNLSTWQLVNAQRTTEGHNLERRMRSCATIANSSQRASCYDGLSVDWGFRAPDVVAPQQGVGAWRTSITTNPLTDAQRVVLLLESPTKAESYSDNVTLALRCDGGVTDLYVIWDTYLSINNVPVTARVGTASAQTLTWIISTSNETTFYPGSNSTVVNFVKSLLGQGSFVVQTTPYGDSPVTATFDIYGIDNAIVPLRQACGW
jgi:type VI secretion system protein VasI